jgi:hypothetical protein
MIKEKDKDEKNFIKQIKEDIESYNKHPDFKEFIVFIYDPYKKTKDKKNFENLN